MKTTNDVRLGTRGPSVFPIALGCMGMGAGSWDGDSDEAESVATIPMHPRAMGNTEGLLLPSLASFVVVMSRTSVQISK